MSILTLYNLFLCRFSSSRCTINDLNKDLRRLLHIHILPAIKLTSADLHKVEEAMIMQQSYIDTINMRILSIQQIIDKRRTALKTRRQLWISLLKGILFLFIKINTNCIMFCGNV